MLIKRIKQAGDGNKDDGAEADKTVGLGRDVKDGGKLIHQGDDADRQAGEPDPPALVIGEKIGPAKQIKK